MLTVTIRTRPGNYALGLDRESFQLIDETENRPIAFFNSSEDPVSLAVLIDTSESMQIFDLKNLSRPGPIGESLTDLFQLGNSGNEYFLAAFDRKVRFLTDWSNSRSLLAGTTNITVEGKNTAFYDACFETIDKLRTGHFPRKILLVITDGLDNLSHHTFKELRELLKHSDVMLYAISIRTPADVGSSLGMEGRSILEELAEVTGGEVFIPENKTQMSQVMNMLATQLRHQYRVGFWPSKTDPPNRWRRLKLRVKVPSDAAAEFQKLDIRTRQGYYTR